LYGVVAFNFSGIAASGALIGSAFSATTAPSGNPASADKLTTDNISITIGTQAALLFGFCVDVNNTSAPTPGTTPSAFTGRPTVWASNAVALPEDFRVTVTGTYAATFGSNNTNRFDTFDVIALAFLEATNSVSIAWAV
jgi:hypothetical protein